MPDTYLFLHDAWREFPSRQDMDPAVQLRDHIRTADEAGSMFALLVWGHGPQEDCPPNCVALPFALS